MNWSKKCKADVNDENYNIFNTKQKKYQSNTARICTHVGMHYDTKSFYYYSSYILGTREDKFHSYFPRAFLSCPIHFMFACNLVTHLSSSVDIEILQYMDIVFLGVRFLCISC